MGAVLSCAALFYLKAWLVGQLRRESRTGIPARPVWKWRFQEKLAGA